MTLSLNVNGRNFDIADDPATPLLWVLRDTLGLTGTKYGCGMAQCGACTVHGDGQPLRACVVPLAAAAQMKITTIEGLGDNHPLQEAFVRHNVPQCGYCQSGQIMTAAALLANKPNPDDAELVAAMNGNICRCGTYQRIKVAIKDAAQVINAGREGGA